MKPCGVLFAETHSSCRIYRHLFLFHSCFPAGLVLWLVLRHTLWWQRQEGGAGGVKAAAQQGQGAREGHLFHSDGLRVTFESSWISKLLRAVFGYFAVTAVAWGIVGVRGRGKREEFFVCLFAVGEFSTFLSLPLNANSSLFSVTLDLFWLMLAADKPPLLSLVFLIDLLGMQVLAFCAHFFPITLCFFSK